MGNRLLKRLEVCFKCTKRPSSKYLAIPSLTIELDSFFEEIHRIGLPEYSPSLKDIVRMREKTIMVQELKFKLEDQTVISLLDMGGQRKERKKWIHQFQNASSILFIASLSEFDMTCFVSRVLLSN